MSSNSNINEIKKRKALFSAKVIPWFEGFSDDLIFYIAINTLFFSDNLDTKKIKCILLLVFSTIDATTTHK
mgnify:CR=1 FL=1